MDEQQLVINGVMVIERRMTFARALGAGFFEGEHFPGDWTGRAYQRPLDYVFVYHIETRNGEQLLGYVDGEGAMFGTLHDWLAGLSADDQSKAPRRFSCGCEPDGENCISHGGPQ